MKKIILILLFPFSLLFAQAPQGFNYQATVSNLNGQLIVNKNVLFKFNIKQNSPTSLPVFSETHDVATDDLGQVSLIIGRGTATIGNFATIDWGNGNYYLAIELNTGNGYVAMGTTQLLSVPYALYANKSNNAQSTVYDLKTILAKNNDANDFKISNLANATDPNDMVNLEALTPFQNQFEKQQNLIQKFDAILKKEIANPTTLIWQKNIGGTNNDEINSVENTADGGYIIAGSAKSNDGDVSGNHSSNYDIWVVKTDADGTIAWQKTYGGTNSDTAANIRNTADGGYIVTGTTFSSEGDLTANKGNGDIWVLKISTTGAIQWQKTYGGAQTDIASSILQNADGSYFILGATNSTDGDLTKTTTDSDLWVLKINATGIIQWQKTFGGTDDEFASSLQLSTDGALMISGNTFFGRTSTTSGTSYSDEIYLLKINTNGLLVWQKTLGGTSADLVSKTITTPDGGYLIGGFSNSTDLDLTENKGNFDMWVVKLTSGGTIDWKKSYGGTKWDKINNLKITTDGGYLIIGETASTNGDLKGGKGLIDSCMIKISSSGTIEWRNTLGGTGADKGIAAFQTTDGSILLFGNSNSTDGDFSNNKGNSDITITKIGLK